jgi:hypothetical protein
VGGVSKGGEYEREREDGRGVRVGRGSKGGEYGGRREEGREYG